MAVEMRRVLVAVLAATLGCLGASAERDDELLVAFYTRPLNPALDSLSRLPSHYWSQNDDFDSIVVVLSGLPDSGAVSVSAEAYVEFHDWEADTVTTTPGRWVPLGTNRTLDITQMQRRVGVPAGRVALVIEPSAFETLLPTSLREKEFITVIRATARVFGDPSVSDTLALMWPGI